MTSNYLISFVVGLVFGAGYGLLNVKSPAPPIFALFGLLGMVVGEQGVPWAKQHFLYGQDKAAHTTSESIEVPRNNLQGPSRTALDRDR